MRSHSIGGNHSLVREQNDDLGAQTFTHASFMAIYVQVPRKIIRISGWPHSGWRATDAYDPGGKELPFRFAVTDDGSGGYLLTYESLDGVYCADSCHSSVEDAMQCAADSFGVSRAEWSVPRSSR